MTDEDTSPDWEEEYDYPLRLGMIITTMFWVMDFTAAKFASGLDATLLTMLGTLAFAQTLFLGWCRDRRQVPEKPSPALLRVLWVIILCQGAAIIRAAWLFSFPVSMIYALIGYTVFLICVITGRRLA